MSRAHWRRLLTVAVFVSSYIALGAGVVSDLLEDKPPPNWMLEDHGYYEAAYDRAHAGGDAYEDRVIGTAFLYPPQSLLYVATFAAIERPTAKASAFFGASLVALTAMLLLLRRYSKPSLGAFVVGIPIALFFGPLVVSTYLGQINLFACLAVVIAVVTVRAAPFWSGVALSVAAGLKLTPLAYGALIVGGRWKPFLLGLVLGSATLFVCAGAAFGWHQYAQFLAALEQLSRSFPLGSDKFALANAVYLFGHKVGVDLEPRLALIQMLINVCSLMLFVVVMWLGRTRPNSHWTYVALALVITLTPNIVWYHHFVFLLPAVLVVFWESRDDWGRWIAGAYLLVIQLLPWAIPSNYRPAVMTSCSVLLLGFVLRRLIQEPETSLRGEAC